MPKISLTVPVYKVEAYLPRCVDSLLAQTFTDFELILVDDGSPDKSGAICDEYAARDERIHVIHQPNGGLSAARNAGIDWAFANSNSEWLAFVDSDDWVHPRFLERLYSAATENDVELSICDYMETDGASREERAAAAGVAVVDGIDFFVSEKNVVATVAWNKLYKKELFSDLRYPVGKLHEDEYLTYKLLHKAGKAAYVKETLYFYFINTQGITRNTYTVKRTDAVPAIEEQCRFFSSIGKQEYHDLWVRKLIGIEYPSHIINLNGIGEKKLARALRRKGRRLALSNPDAVKRLDAYQKEQALRAYYPGLNHIVMPLRNLRRMVSRGGLREALRYYKRKLSKHK